MAEHSGHICPACRAPLCGVATGDYVCSVCERTYPTIAGVVDLRLGSDRYLSLDEDRAKALALAERADRSGLSFAEMVRAYWDMTPEVPVALAERYTRNAVDGVRRAQAWLQAAGPPRPGESVLDVGCGTGALAVAAARAGGVVTGVDVALRWLVVARRLVEEQGVNAALVAADGSLLPYRAGSFDLVLSVETLEHAADQRGLLQHCLLACRPGGRVLLVTGNRFSLAVEPNVRLWGLGFLPRRWTASYVRARRHTRSQFLRPLSPWELKAMVGLRSDVRVGAGPLPVPATDASGSRRVTQLLYERARTSGPGRRLMTPVAPFLEISGTIGPGRSA